MRKAIEELKKIHESDMKRKDSMIDAIKDNSTKLEENIDAQHKTILSLKKLNYELQKKNNSLSDIITAIVFVASLGVITMFLHLLR